MKSASLSLPWVAMKRLLIFAVLAASPLSAQQVADTLFVPRVSAPSYPANTGPRLVIDEAHHNFHTVDGRYAPFAKLARRDGYRVSGGTTTITPASLAGVDILVIANALAQKNDSGKWVLPTPSFVTAEEIDAIHRWVEGGGSLLLIADHMPFAGAAERLASTFGVTWVNGFADDSTGNSILRYRRGAGLGTHAITSGRNAGERIDSVTAFTGSAFFLRDGGAPIFTLPAGTRVLMPATAWAFTDSTASVNGSGMLQLAALEIGKGRVVVAGEAAMFSAQRAGPNGAQTMGFNAPVAGQNAQFTLNVLHWLGRRL
jgi:hypothetical protein